MACVVGIFIFAWFKRDGTGLAEAVDQQIFGPNARQFGAFPYRLGLLVVSRELWAPHIDRLYPISRLRRAQQTFDGAAGQLLLGLAVALMALLLPACIAAATAELPIDPRKVVEIVVLPLLVATLPPFLQWCRLHHEVRRDPNTAGLSPRRSPATRDEARQVSLV